MTRLRMPGITAATTEGQIRQIVAYLRLLVEELNGVLSQMEGEKDGNR